MTKLDAICCVISITQFLLGLWAGGRIARQRPDIGQWFWGL
jgi:hypothetical protein